jgi:hypothetical protein
VYLVYTKSARQGIAKSARAVLTYARSYVQKTFFEPPVGLLRYRSLYKNLVKTQELSSSRLRIQESIFLCPIQNLKAVAMGMGVVTARALVW